MSHFTLLRQVISGLWLMDQQSGDAYLPAVAQLLRGEKVTAFGPDDDDHQSEPYCVHEEDEDQRISSEFKNHHVPEGSIAVIPIEGPLMKADYCGIPGMSTIASWIQNAEGNPNIIGTILYIDSPGGTVDGTAELARVISSAEKPIVTFVDGLIASAAYWLGSSADYIICHADTDLIGSIGTQIRLMDYSGWYEEMGIKEHLVRAEKSKDKNKAVEEAKKGNYKPLKVELLDPSNEVFLNSVKENRGEKLSADEGEPLTGKVYLLNEAISHGLIDSKGTFRDAVEKVQELSQSSTNSNSNMRNKFKSLAAVAGKQKKGEAVAAEEIEAVNAELEAAGITDYSLHQTSEVEQSQGRVTALETERTAVARILEPEATEEEIAGMNLTEEVQELADALTESEQALEASQEEVKKLGAQSPKPKKATSKKTESEIESEEEEEPEYYSEADAELDKTLKELNED